MRLAGPGKLERNDKYGKWIGRIETVCEAWDNFSSNVLDAVSALKPIETDVEVGSGLRSACGGSSRPRELQQTVTGS